MIKNMSDRVKNGILDPPTNLKEAIDWILRVTNRDGLDDTKTHTGGVSGLAGEVKKLLIPARKHVKERNIKDLIDKVTLALEQERESGDIAIGGILVPLSEKLKTFIGSRSLVDNSLKADGIASSGYVSAYRDNAKWSKSFEKIEREKCAQIFLGCIPLIFSGLSYLYWQCNVTDGSYGQTLKVRANATIKNEVRWTGTWAQVTTTDISKTIPQRINDETTKLSVFMETMGYDKHQLSDKKGADVEELLRTFLEFKECKDVKKESVPSYAQTKIQTTKIVEGPYAEYIEFLYGHNVAEVMSNRIEDRPLVNLFIATQSYFQVLQSKYPSSCGKKPKSIREMLYWLMGLPYSPMYLEIRKSHLKDLLHKSYYVIDFVNGGKDSLPFALSSAIYYLLASCFYSGFALMAIEGELKGNVRAAKDRRSDPVLLHEIFANTGFRFHYPPTVQEWFSMLWDVVCPVYSQLTFLRTQCQKCLCVARGWEWCTYGQSVKCENIKSWICESEDLSKIETRKDGAITCTEANCKVTHADCGKDRTKPSPLQAYLTDVLPGFEIDASQKDEYSVPGHDVTLALTSKQRTKIAMGFATHLPASKRRGYHLFWTLKDYTEDKITEVSVYNIILSLLSSGLRAPSTLGDLFGFFLFLGRFYSSKGSDNSLKDVLVELIDSHPGVHKSHEDGSHFTDYIEKLHGTSSDNHEGLISLHQCTTVDTSCGKYLYPLSYAFYKTLSLKHASIYLSWAVYLPKELKLGLQQLYEDFNKIDCMDSKCKECRTGITCRSGTHGEKDKCHCKTIVQCAGVLPLFYKYGFVYNNAEALNGNLKEVPLLSEKRARKCHQFSEQLQNVLDSDALTKLVDGATQFLINLRFPFMMFTAAMWLAVFLYFMYALLVPLNILRFGIHGDGDSGLKASPITLLAYTTDVPKPVYVWP
ncbi:uncharacterized protein BXIN_1882 [Babesia sp. Xinjiang]|uniref:uncharacterized protein n=1 Tax=Babesia sp. Xinjiang TaxID=462227 RepID=UPI000A239381|nr:uncharacterized protein BXIN_1882 [Babesia sp. Xinjiang]ORM40344.1 hypothetical protein BXIN_1882 [Babesia sp. Xinjiang]